MNANVVLLTTIALREGMFVVRRSAGSDYRATTLTSR